MLGAYHAAHAGLEVLLLDQHESRQDRADGDALFPRAVAEVSLMGPRRLARETELLQV